MGKGNLVLAHFRSWSLSARFIGPGRFGARLWGRNRSLHLPQPAATSSTGTPRRKFRSKRITNPLSRGLFGPPTFWSISGATKRLNQSQNARAVRIVATASLANPGSLKHGRIWSVFLVSASPIIRYGHTTTTTKFRPLGTDHLGSARDLFCFWNQKSIVSLSFSRALTF